MTHDDALPSRLSDDDLDAAMREVGLATLAATVPQNRALLRGYGRAVEQRVRAALAARAPAADEPLPAPTEYCWLVEEFGPDGNSTGRYMLDQGALTITRDAHRARRFRRRQVAGFRAADMRERHGGDWRAVEHGFDAPRTGVRDLRDAKWLDPECADDGACQSLRFKAAIAACAEPVAWIHPKVDRALTASQKSELSHDGGAFASWVAEYSVPLYTAPPPALPQDAARADPVWAADGWRQECDDADAVLRLIGLDPERCRTEGGWLNVPKIRTMLRDRVLVYLCPAGCGCTWRDNGDGSMSLYGPSSRSCAACETMPLSKLVPVYATPPATSAEPVTVSTSDEPKSDTLSVERDANADAPPALPPGAREAMRMAADALRAIVRHWDEFGPEHGFDEVVDKARNALRPWVGQGD